MTQTGRQNALLIDLDGTLVDSAADIREGVNYSLGQLQLTERSLEEVVSYIGDGVRELITRAVRASAETYDSAIIDQALELFSEYYTENILVHTVLYPGVEKALSALHPKTHLFVVSNKRESYCKTIVDGLGIGEYFTEVIGGDTLSDRKPSPVSIRYLQKKYGFTPARMVFVGDHYTDLEAANNGNIRSVYCAYGMGDPRGASSDHTVNSFDELTGLDLFPGSFS